MAIYAVRSIYVKPNKLCYLIYVRCSITRDVIPKWLIQIALKTNICNDSTSTSPSRMTRKVTYIGRLYKCHIVDQHILTRYERAIHCTRLSYRFKATQSCSYKRGCYFQVPLTTKQHFEKVKKMKTYFYPSQFK